MNEEKTQDNITDVKSVLSYLKVNNWRYSATTIYRHISIGKLRRNKEGVFEIKTINLYAKKNLKPLIVLEEDAQNDETSDYQMNDVDTENTFADVKGVRAYLASRGWDVTKTTLYRHVNERKLKRDHQGRFDVVVVEQYARKFLKPLAVINASSEKAACLFHNAINIFLRDTTEKIICFLSVDSSRAEELKAFLINETRKYFKLQPIQSSAENVFDGQDSHRNASDNTFIEKENMPVQ